MAAAGITIPDNKKLEIALMAAYGYGTIQGALVVDQSKSPTIKHRRI